ncbi:hypothetical protein PIB30_017791 [Stylosanthes scabra]|uniref:Uncharacterized protein n=1 Tax=Stylosanthes scabra TaxID=79078 RepID=A0ABU6U6N5_9FABA|nr:hypothetical protein [Stylosanthes scabra]
MAYIIRNFVVLSTLFLILAIATCSIEANKDGPEVVVEAMVYCQSCDHIGTWSLSEAKAVGSAKVSVTCKNQKGQVFYYKVFDTDKNGYLYAQLEGFKMQHYILDHPLHSCYVKLVWSPLESCGLLSNVNYGLSGAPLRYENKRLHGGGGSNYEAVIYAAGPLAFRPTNCLHDTTTHHG